MQHRMFSAREEPEKPQRSVRTTIVGGRSQGDRAVSRQIPRGIEVLVKKAAVDAAFRARLLKDRSRAARSIELTLDPAEAGIIDSLPEQALLTMVDKARVPTSQRKAFMSSAAAVMLAAIGAMPSQATAQETNRAPTITWQGEYGPWTYDIYTSDDLETWSFVTSLESLPIEMSWRDETANDPTAIRRFYSVRRVSILSKGIMIDEPIKVTRVDLESE